MVRLQLQGVLEELLGTGNVYFQPPPTLVMQYPCIVYHVDSADTKFADNASYRYKERYQITCIDTNPDCPFRFEVAKLPSCTFNRWYAARNLNHYVYNLYI